MEAPIYQLTVYIMQQDFTVKKILIDLANSCESVETILAKIKSQNAITLQETMMVCRYSVPVKLHEMVHHTEQLEIVLPLQISANEKRRKKLLRMKNR